MVSSTTTPGSPCSSYLPCYFTYTPPTYDHFSVETPSASPTPIHSPGQPDCDPSHPLLSYRPPHQQATTMASSDLMRMQSNAAQVAPIRPRPVPQQNLLQVTSDDSITSSNSSNRSSSTSSSNSGCSSRTSLDMFSSPEAARCSRCQSTSSVDLRTGKSNMVQYGLNLWYCSRCAGMVGLVQR
jgi:hypothetical protein